jgi:hypothetical protein
MSAFANLFLWVFIVLMMAACQEEAVPFDLLNGAWKHQAEGDQEIGECWEKLETGGFKGIGWTLQNGDTVFKEKMDILKTDSGWFYMAHPAMAERPTFFKVEEMTDSGFVALNPRHDYPQSISYQMIEGELKISLKGSPNFEGEVFEEWTMKRSVY